VVKMDEFILWRAKQKAKYLQANPDKDPANKKAADTTARSPTPPVAVNR
jgi:hypothetical protein